MNHSLSEAVNSLLKDPISIDPEDGESDPENLFYNGGHRLAAMKRQGVTTTLGVSSVPEGKRRISQGRAL